MEKMENFVSNTRKVIKDLRENTLTPVVIIMPDGCPLRNWEPKELSPYPNLKGGIRIPNGVSSENRYYPASGNFDMYLNGKDYLSFREAVMQSLDHHKVVFAPIYKKWRFLIKACLEENVPYAFGLPATDPDSKETTMEFSFKYHDDYKDYRALEGDSVKRPDIPSDYEILDIIADIEKFNLERPGLAPIIRLRNDQIQIKNIIGDYHGIARLITAAIYDGHYIDYSSIFE